MDPRGEGDAHVKPHGNAMYGSIARGIVRRAAPEVAILHHPLHWRDIGGKADGCVAITVIVIGGWLRCVTVPSGRARVQRVIRTMLPGLCWPLR